MYLLLQARTEALTCLDDGLDALTALKREYLARIAELVQPGSIIAIRRDPADEEFPNYRCADSDCHILLADMQ